MKLSVIVSLLLPFTCYVAANPAPVGVTVDKRSSQDLEDRSLICKLDLVLLAFKAVAAKATPYCSSYLHIPTSTIVKTTTPLTTTTVTDVTTYTQNAAAKRAQPTPIPIPSGLSIFVASQISSACSCLSISETVITTTTTAPTLVVSTTTTATTTTSLLPPPPLCSTGQTDDGEGLCTCDYIENCSSVCSGTYVLLTTNVANYNTCLQNCDEYLDCNYYFYDPSSQTCYVYDTEPTCHSGYGVFGTRQPDSCFTVGCGIL
ncbi:hypothetical protein N431DRAFT_461848 [Stipitochalara longipes BDJ]|nr:hypothetical protein N431DRAFT_461848 [Stipitochalara longipes BDJ]